MTAIATLGKHRSFGGEQGFYEHDSEACGGAMKFSVYLPPAAERAAVPAVYYLAGLTCTEETFAAKAGAQRIASDLGVALVCPDTSPRKSRFPGDDAAWDFGLGAGFYVDATKAPWSSAYRMETYVTRELVRVVQANFPIAGDRRGIFGHSMGGHGALVLALRNRDLYASVSALAPIASPTRCPWGEKAFGGYLAGGVAEGEAYDASLLLRAAPLKTRLLVDQGLSDKFLSGQLKPELLEEACTASGQSLELRRHAGYDHGYFFVATFVEEHLRHHAKSLL